jgi:hypothetical protein
MDFLLKVVDEDFVLFKINNKFKTTPLKVNNPIKRNTKNIKITKSKHSMITRQKCNYVDNKMINRKILYIRTEYNL